MHKIYDHILYSNRNDRQILKLENNLPSVFHNCILFSNRNDLQTDTLALLNPIKAGILHRK